MMIPSRMDKAFSTFSNVYAYFLYLTGCTSGIFGAGTLSREHVVHHSLRRVSPPHVTCPTPQSACPTLNPQRFDIRKR